MDLLFITIALLFCAFFSGIEIAYLTSNNLKIELDNKQGAFFAWLLSTFLKHPSRFIGTLLVGNYIALVFYAILIARLLESVFYRWELSGAAIMLLQTVIATLIILVVGEFLPKTLFRINSNFILKL